MGTTSHSPLANFGTSVSQRKLSDILKDVPQGTLSIMEYCSKVSHYLSPSIAPVVAEQRTNGHPIAHACETNGERDESNINVVIRVLDDGLLEAQSILTTADEADPPSLKLLIDLFDQSVDLPGVPPELNLHWVQTLRRLCVKGGTLPTSCTIERDALEVLGRYPVAGGGYADVWRGKMGSRKVAIKALRLRYEDGERLVRKNFCQEVLIWKRLTHKNIVAFLGINTTKFALGIVSEWMENDNVTRYLLETPTANRRSLLLDVSYGLQYLHSVDLLHGDLKCANILVDEEDHARIADFGLSAIVHDPNLMPSQASITNGSVRWMAPELFDPEDVGLDRALPTKATDVYSLGVVMWEMFSGRPPFPECRMDAAVIYRVLSGARPKRQLEMTAKGLTDSLWALMQQCWNADRSQRPLIKDVINRLSQEVSTPVSQTADIPSS